MSFTWYDSTPEFAVNPASSLFTAALNEVGRTYPVINRIRTWTGAADTAADEIARAINGPVLERAGSRVRLVRAAPNTATALMRVPGNGPWWANVDVQSVRRFAAGDTRSGEALRGVLPSLPASGAILVRIRSNERFAINTLRHERQHAEHIRRACELVFGDWERATAGLAETWFDAEAALDAALFRAANLADLSGDRLRRLAGAIFAPVGVQADALHNDPAANQFAIATARWIASEPALEIALTEYVAPRPPAAVARAPTPRRRRAALA